MPLPRFNPGVPNADLSQVRSFQPSGAQAEASMWNEMAGDMSRVSRVWGEIEDRRVANEQEAAGKVAGADPNFDPMTLRKQAVTMADTAFRKGAVASYMSNLDLQKSEAFTTINAESFEDPALMRRRMEQYVDATAAKMPLEVAVDYKQGAMREADAYYANAMSAAAGRARSQQKDDIQAGIELSERKLKEMGTPTTPEAQAAYSLEAAKLKVKQEQAMQAGIYTPNQIAVRNQVLQEDLQDGTMYQAVGSQPADMRLDFAMKVAEGKSGTGLDMLSPEKRWRAVQVAQQMNNADDVAQRARDTMQRRQVQAQMIDITANVLKNPEAPDSQESVRKAIAIANTPEAVNQAYKLADYINNPNADRFKVQTREYAEHLAWRAARGDLDQQDVDGAFGADRIGNRIDAADWERLSANVRAVPRDIVKGNAWRTFVAQLENEFPVPQPMSPQDAALAAAGFAVNRETGSDGISQEQKLRNRALVTETLNDAQQKIISGDIASENLLTSYAGRKITELRQQFGSGLVDPANRKKPAAPQGAFSLVGSDEGARNLYQQYKGDKAGFVARVKAGEIDRRTANAVWQLLNSEGEK